MRDTINLNESLSKIQFSNLTFYFYSNILSTPLKIKDSIHLTCQGVTLKIYHLS